MERDTNTHGPAVDDEMAREVAAITHGAPVEARAEEDRFPEDAGGAELGAFAGRTDLARHLRPSVFPARRDALVRCAIETHAPDGMVEQLRALRDGEVFATTNDVWTALGGESEPPAGHGRRHGAAAPAPGERGQRGRERARETYEVPRRRFPFRFDLRFRIAALLFGVTPENAYVDIVPDPGGGTLYVSFGPWKLTTALQNVVRAEQSGPFSIVRTIGPPHLSLADRGVTFASNDAAGVCMRFADPVPAIEPLALVRHPAATVTVADCDGLLALLAHERAARAAR